MKSVIVAHRAGNNAEAALRAAELADLIELDVHVHRGRVEVRHEKVFWPTSRLWERWYFLPSSTRVAGIDEVLDAVGPETALFLDLKVMTGWAAARISRSVGQDRPLVVSSRSWLALRTFRGRANTIRLRSCGTAWQLWLATRLPGLGDEVGIVAHERLLNRNAIREVLSTTPILYTWAIPSVERANALVEAGVMGLIVDDLGQDWP